MLLRGQENPVKEFDGDLDVVLEISLCKLVACDRAQIENELFASPAEHLDHILAFLHANYCPVVEMHLNSEVGVCSEVA